jgi:hypothetical protein
MFEEKFFKLLLAAVDGDMSRDLGYAAKKLNESHKRAGLPV